MMEHSDAVAMVEGIEGKGGLRELAAIRDARGTDFTYAMGDLHCLNPHRPALRWLECVLVYGAQVPGATGDTREEQRG